MGADREKLLPCPFCKCPELNHFSQWTAADDGMVEIKKIQCVGCHAEALEKRWNTRVPTPTPGYADAIEAAAKVAEEMNWPKPLWGAVEQSTQPYCNDHYRGGCLDAATAIRALSQPEGKARG